MAEQFEQFLKLSEELRAEYRKSLLPIKPNWEAILHQFLDEIPMLLSVIYSKVGGTLYTVEDQSLMDFIPGFLIIHIDEYKKNYNEVNLITKKLDFQGIYLPLLRNYSSDFYVFDTQTHNVCLLNHDDAEINVLYNNPLDFLETLVQNYKKEVYFLDDDGFLDYYPDKEYAVAAEMNPEIEFWKEE